MHMVIANGLHVLLTSACETGQLTCLIFNRRHVTGLMASGQESRGHILMRCVTANKLKQVKDRYTHLSVCLYLFSAGSKVPCKSFFSFEKEKKSPRLNSQTGTPRASGNG